MNFVTGLLVVLAAFITASGQLLMKKGSQVLHEVLSLGGDYSVGHKLFKKMLVILLEPHIVIALILYFSGLFLWLKILTRAELSHVYPVLISLVIVVTSILSFFLFKESVTGFKIAGVIFIIVGIFLITQGAK
ncbi:MAG: hypothetical protein A2939_04115 [Parcubacteria group bacterium RIFCSPLOWO2_01_FULL_48_18]|nr:MAG: hypothetical protein A3J67_05325 [Parcubacteria group bacterium RIFCSPHIGHO2_02_FULL_48_10b]OHB22764.1 MAG: hypothetical protein A2939_04115 [Parcubacteria group bacterium RIFCSPLOWO2_01_FULL_48_18]